MIFNQDSQLTITVCTLDEESNISSCLTSLIAQDPFEIIVVDGGSEDKTCSIAEKFKVTIVNSGRKGLAYQRKLAVENVKTKYVAMMDADHRPEEGCLHGLIHELTENNFDGIEAHIFSLNNRTYWDSSMEQNFILDHNFAGPRNMIGTPCVYKTEVLKKNNYDPFFTGPSDDTDLCYRLIKLGYKLGVGTKRCFQIHRSSFQEFKRKWIWYGKGDAQFVKTHPERTASIMKHLLFNYPIRKSFLAIKNKKFKLVPFFVLCGTLRFYGFVKETTKIALGKKEDKEIYKT
jgi:glycosyltransferase involved in cell wall biosynthesis